MSTSARTGGSKHQYVQAKIGIFRAVIPYQGKRHSFGPFAIEFDATTKVKLFSNVVKDKEADFETNVKQEEVDKLSTELAKVRQLAESSARLGLHVQQSFSDEVGNT